MANKAARQKTAYLNANVDADIFMKQPEGFEEKGPNGEKLVCKLNKSLYGLKQSGRNWYYTLKAFLEEIGFVVCVHDSCLFVRHVNDCVNAVVCVCGLMISFIVERMMTLLIGLRKK